jgi:hypothetical protein
MSTTRSKDCRVGVRLKPWDLQRLVQILGGDEMVTGLSVELSDGCTVTLEDASEFGDLDNVKGRSINALTVESAPANFQFSEQSRSRLAVVTVRPSPSATVRYHVSGDERAVISLSAELDEWVNAISPWYGRLAAADSAVFAFASIVLLGAMIAGTAGLYLWLGGQPGVAADGGTGWVARYAVSGALLGLLALGTLLNIRRRHLLPLVMFLVGKGADRSRRCDQHRKVLLQSGALMIGLALCGSVLGALVS